MRGNQKLTWQKVERTKYKNLSTIKITNFTTQRTYLNLLVETFQKFSYIYLYIFHNIYLTKYILEMILSHTKIFNIFPSSFQLGNMLKILTNNCDRKTINHIPARSLDKQVLIFSFKWIKKFFVDHTPKIRPSISFRMF